MTLEMIEQMLEKPYWIVDILPWQVPAGSPGQYFAVEQYYLREPQITELRRKYFHLLLKLGCYYDVNISMDDGEHWTENPSPEELKGYLLGDSFTGCMHVLFKDEDTMAVLDANDTYMTVYNPADGLIRLLKELTSAEGLFVWKPGD